MTGTSSFPTTTRPHYAILAVGGAALSTALIWTAAHALGVELRVDPRNGQPPGAISLPFAVTVTLAASPTGWGVRTAEVAVDLCLVRLGGGRPGR